MRLVRFALVAALLLPALPAAAQTTQPTINVGRLEIQFATQNSNGTDYTVMNLMDRQQFFNNAHCQCGTTVYVKGQLIGAPTGNLGTTPVNFWVGQGCDTTDTPTRTNQCKQLATDQIQNFHVGFKAIPFTATEIMFPLTGTCASLESTANSMWALVDSNGDGFGDTGGVFQLSDENGTATTIPIDTKPPTAVGSPSVTGVENAFSVSWTVNEAEVNGLRGYQILCQSVSTGGPLFLTPQGDREYVRPEDVDGCVPGSSGTPDGGVAADAGVADAGTDMDGGTGNAGFDNLDPSFICGFAGSGTATGARIDLGDGSKLVPGAADMGIRVKVVAVDYARNPGASSTTAGSGPAAPVRDAWEHYHDQGGQAEGGYCFVATAAYGDYDHPYVKVLRRFRDETLAPTAWGRDFIAWYYAHSPPWADFLRAHPVARVTAALLLFPVVVVAAIWNSLGVVGLLGLALAGYAIVRWRRRRVLKLAAAAAALLAVVAIGGGRAHAQAWLDQDEMEHEDTGPKPPNWTFEIKLGPYFPDIDGEAGVTGKPYETMFGSGSSLLPQIELDRYFFHPLGELGIGVSVGYMSNGAKSFKQGPDGKALCTDNTSMCRSADNNDFTMFPLALLAVYRFTALADRTVIPLVPYAKLGLSYYIWHMSKGDGDVSSIDGNDGAGATLGWQGTIGISLRAERLDPEAARAMSSELGVDHIGFFAELTVADVSGLGMDKKLHVGDTTWSAGLNFEF